MKILVLISEENEMVRDELYESYLRMLDNSDDKDIEFNVYLDSDWSRSQ